MKDIGEDDVIVGIRIKRESNGISISQSYYIEKVLKKFNYFDCTLVSTPIDTSEKLIPNNGQAISQLKYSRIIDCRMYAMTCTRPNITYAMGKLSSILVIQILSAVLEGYTNASWISNTEYNSSTSGWVFLLGGGEDDVIVGIRIKCESNGISISQSYYIEKVLKKFNYFDCTLVSTPIDTSEKLIPNNGQAVSQLEYSRIIGCLMYAMTCTRPDIAYAMGKLSSILVIRILSAVLEGYTNASWISNTEYNSSTNGWVFLLGGGLISWASKKQTCPGSIMESEFMALATANKEAEWLRNLILVIPVWSKPVGPISICYDSVATLAKAYNQMYNRMSRHLGVRHSMICELITNRVVSIEFVRSQQNLADHLTKGLARDLVLKSAERMGLKSNQVDEC
nr:zinc finger, CCHC-type [Tanacetum cinerariifolium]